MDLSQKIARWYSDLSPNKVGQLPDGLTALFGDNVRRMGGLGRGTCLLYACLTCLDPAYRAAKTDAKREMGLAWRKDLGQFLTLEEYAKIFKLDVTHPDTTRLHLLLQSEILSIDEDTGEADFLGQNTYQVIMAQKNVNLVMLRLLTDSVVCQQDPSDNMQSISQSPFDPTRPTMYICNIGDYHYEAMYIQENGERRYLFQPDDDIVDKVRKHYFKCCKRGEASSSVECAPMQAFQRYVSKNLRACVAPPNCEKHDKGSLIKIAQQCRIPGYGGDLTKKNRQWLCAQIRETRDKFVTSVADLSVALGVSQDAAMDLYERFGTGEKAMSFALDRPGEFQTWLAKRGESEEKSAASLAQLLPMAEEIKEVSSNYSAQRQILANYGFQPEAVNFIVGSFGGRIPADDAALLNAAMDAMEQFRPAPPATESEHVHKKQRKKAGDAEKHWKSALFKVRLVVALRKIAKNTEVLRELIDKLQSEQGIKLDATSAMLQGSTEDKIALLSTLVEFPE